MKIRTGLISLAAIAAILFSISALSTSWWPFFGEEKSAAVQGDLTELTWEDLIPADFVQPENPFITMSQEKIDQLMDGSEESQAELARLQEIFNYAPVVEELDGKRVKIPAYVTPLEYNEHFMVKEFLLVPYVGACMHSPPPPANQIVHAQSQKAVKVPDIYEAVWAIGTIRAETIKSDLAESGYRLELEEVLPYEASDSAQ